MSVLDRLPELLEPQVGIASMPLGEDRVYAIAFDLDTEILKITYGEQSYPSAYRAVRRIFEDEGFVWVQGSLYYGNRATDPVKCVLIVQRLARELPWFGNAVRDIRMLRIDENNDLKPAIPQPELPL